ncbi:hypothetical protein HELRODRAFT_175855 [Helobdella robusta]|uniref:Cadherin domain-containing protein n=1 Tax=Helobdella robusta TaxID=6412 RepID=T1F9S4_HELRO|nr:hypothetical protein HELRODRAFT_175855 [Helobdella robusta]ESO00432.1 hypothetical protein HELRODRAFT_175855 [Helobdella robusta]
MSHTDSSITYELLSSKSQPVNEFAIDSTSGVVELMKKLDYDQDPLSRQYQLKVLAIDNYNSPITGTVDLIVNILDANDNAPTFYLSQYSTQSIPEDVKIGTEIIKDICFLNKTSTRRNLSDSYLFKSVIWLTAVSASAIVRA